ncbi:hypothetical protein PCASD_18547 [Puccinia coronata f. sp. avenae]|uniref:Uncharacterized protein n=1 Tax=Puccinia coronata f. sp. avenae TaxID=200324 RepID=A0A2N5U0Z0_9BASI|nr:hypothetical protein PCASD_18547 [Puccinia coronata f. sp. avenae]
MLTWAQRNDPLGRKRYYKWQSDQKGGELTSTGGWAQPPLVQDENERTREVQRVARDSDKPSTLHSNDGISSRYGQQPVHWANFSQAL